MLIDFPKRRLLGLGLGYRFRSCLFGYCFNGCCFGYSFNCCFGCGLLERSLHSCDNLGYGGLLLTWAITLVVVGGLWWYDKKHSYCWDGMMKEG